MTRDCMNLCNPNLKILRDCINCAIYIKIYIHTNNIFFKKKQTHYHYPRGHTACYKSSINHHMQHHFKPQVQTIIAERLATGHRIGSVKVVKELSQETTFSLSPTLPIGTTFCLKCNMPITTAQEAIQPVTYRDENGWMPYSKFSITNKFMIFYNSRFWAEQAKIKRQN